MAIPIDPNKPSDYYIWEPVFRCTIPQLQTTSTTYLRLFGSPTTGHPEIDKSLNDQTLTTYLTIAKMVEYYKKGVPVRVAQYKDTKTIYEYIENHIRAWKRRLETGINIGGAPIEDLITMDQFATSVYQHARHLIDQEEIDSFLIKSMNQVQSINKFNILKPLVTENEEVTKINVDDEPVFPQRDSLADVFKNSRVIGRKWK